MSEATLNPPTLEQINRDLAKTVSEETRRADRAERERDAAYKALREIFKEAVDGRLSLTKGQFIASIAIQALPDEDE